MKKGIKGKNIYIIATGCNGIKRIKELIAPLEKDGANCFLIPTPAALQIMCDNKEYYADCNVCLNSNSLSHQKIPEEDMVIVAPCSFNTTNKIAFGIADNYATSLLHTAIGKGKPIILALSMNIFFWKNFVLQESLKKLENCKNILTVWPEFVYEKGIFNKLTMVPFGKIIDCVYHIFKIVKYQQIRVKEYNNFDSIIKEHSGDFINCGKELIKNNFIQGAAGCIAKRIKEGILVSTAGACIGEMTTENISLILQEKDNTIMWYGHQSPSSESLLISYILSKTKEEFLIHSHCREITYAPQFDEFRTKEYIETGNINTIGQVFNILNSKKGICILKLHGQLVIADSFLSGIEKLKCLKNEITLSKK